MSTTASRLLKALIKVHRYPGYTKFLWQRGFMPWWIARKGVRAGRNVGFIGWPIISMAPESTIEIGDNSLLCSRSKRTALGVNHAIILRTLRTGASISIGRGARISGASICTAKRITIRDDVVIGANATIVDTDFHALDPGQRKSEQDGDLAEAAVVEIKRDAFIGSGSCILKGVVIGQGAFVGAGSVVTKDVPDYVVVAGNPARQIGKVPAGHEHMKIDGNGS